METQAQPVDVELLKQKSLEKTRSWAVAGAVAAVTALFLWAAWPPAGSGMTVDEIRQMYEGDPANTVAGPSWP